MSSFTTTTTSITWDLLLDRLEINAKRYPTKLAVGFVSSGPNGGKLSSQYTYAQLAQQTSVLASYLLDQKKKNKPGLVKGDRAVLVYPPSLEFLVAFLACLKAGIVAVPVFPPNPLRRDTVQMFATIVATCQATTALTSAEYSHQKKLASIQQKWTQWNKKKTSSSDWPDSLQWIVTTDLKHDNSSGNSLNLPPPPPTPDQLAFLQFTSGSTSAPKGVMITHGNVGHNLHIITRELQAQQDTVVVSWLPQYHDMGLIGSCLGVLYCGGSGYYLSPLSFLQRPALWMEAVSRYRATHLQAPNFAYKLTARKATFSSSSKLALDSVRHMINAAEPVDQASMDAFYQAFEPYGLKRGVIYPTYGLAEHTVFVCSGGTQRLCVNKAALEVEGRVQEELVDGTNTNGATAGGTTTTTRLVGCGFPARQGVILKIVDPESCRELPEDRVGEIWVYSDSKAAGYYQKPVETQEDFHAQLASAGTTAAAAYGPEDGYLRTGDLGFLHQNELFICGRRKDLIIVGGRNYYPQDLEATAEAAASVDGGLVRLGCSAAFTIDPTHEGGEEVALIMELKESSTAPDVCTNLVNQVRGSVNQEHSLGLLEVVLLKPRTVPKTSSGKIARAWCRKAYVGGTLHVVYRKSFKMQASSSLEIEDGPGGDDVVSHNNGAPSSSALAAAERRALLSPNDVAGLRAMSKQAILAKLVTDVSRVGSIPEDSVETKTPLVTMLDSLTISQFKGVLENGYAVKISDDYLFRESSTLTKLVEVVKLGYAPDDGETADGGGGGAAGGAPTGTAGGLAGALGCPPGVRCIIL